MPTNKQRMDLLRRSVAEAVGTAFLLAAVVGSGIMGERLSAGNTAVALLANTVATGAALVALILTFGQISGAHLNPAVTLADASQGGIRWRDVPAYIVAQMVGAFAGVAAANVMFGLPVFFHNRFRQCRVETKLQTKGEFHGLPFDRLPAYAAISTYEHERPSRIASSLS